MRLPLLFALTTLPALAFAAGGSDESPPTPTETTTVCEEGMIWDAETSVCVAVKESRLDDTERYLAVREFAYLGEYSHALHALAAMSDQKDDRVLTYRGFIARQQGDWETGLTYYRQALAQNPDNLLARSYMGQGYVVTGDIEAAREQLAQILTRGGSGTWAHTALAQAIVSGQTSQY